MVQSKLAALSSEALEGFRAAQRLAYACAQWAASELQEGVTERQVAERMRRYLQDHGVRDCFHEPFAWFGDRTAFRGVVGWRPLGGFNPAFFPGKRRLQAGMPYILDCAPTLNGYTADIGYSGALGHNPALDQLMDDLIEYRTLILDQVQVRASLASISQAVDALCERHGYEPRHKAYPFQTLAHRVEVLDADGRDLPTVTRFGLRNLANLLRDRVRGAREGWHSIWNGSTRSDHPPTPGLWAVEPHLGFRGVGAKFEELLVVTEDDAWWLDDEVPHVRRWQARGVQAVQEAA